MKKIYTKQRLFEVISKVDKSFKLTENNTTAMGKLTDKQVFDSIINSDDFGFAIDSYKEYIPTLNDEYIHYIIHLSQDKDAVINEILKYRNNIDSEVAFSMLIHSSNPTKLAYKLGKEIVNQIHPEDLQKILSKFKRNDEKEEFMFFLNQG